MERGERGEEGVVTSVEGRGGDEGSGWNRRVASM